MLAWRKFLSGIKSAPEDQINILSYVDLAASRQADVGGAS